MSVRELCAALRLGSERLSQHTELQKNHALRCVAEVLRQDEAAILAANAQDVQTARQKGTSEALVERLALDHAKFAQMLDSMDVIIRQPDPVGQELLGWRTPQGMTIRQVRVPLGIVAIIYESRPNVTVDAFCLAYKSGNAILLRGSSSALLSNTAIVGAIRRGLGQAGADGVTGAVELCQGGHDEVQEILGATGDIDVVLPRGSARLINMVVQNARVPVIQTGAGVCHLYVDQSADVGMAASIAANAKMQRPGACNAIETILVHRDVAPQFLPAMAAAFGGKVQVRADDECYDLLLHNSAQNVVRAVPEDFGFEFLDFTVAVKAVGSVQEAIGFINAHNTRHSEAIVTSSRDNARLFQSQVDAACVYVNASTRFTDGGQFGFGAELGISTQKLHARGPMGIQALTTTKFLIDGDGNIR